MARLGGPPGPPDHVDLPRVFGVRALPRDIIALEFQEIISLGHASSLLPFSENQRKHFEWDRSIGQLPQNGRGRKPPRKKAPPSPAAGRFAPNEPGGGHG